MSADIVATGRRNRVEGVANEDAPIELTFTVGDHTRLVFTTTHAALEGPDGDAIEHLIERFDEHTLRVLEAMAGEAERG